MLFFAPFILRYLVLPWIPYQDFVDAGVFFGDLEDYRVADVDAVVEMFWHGVSFR